MNKKEFLKKNNFDNKDWQKLVRYERVRKSGIVNMFSYLGTMEKEGDGALANWIKEHGNYGEFLEVLEKMQE